jgi:polysaccharide pyruvyl transferase WcaK-like protein
MEKVDENIAQNILGLMRYPERARIFSSGEYNVDFMTSLLRKLSLLLTSRYHASLLSLENLVPQIAIGHDLRLQNLYGELGLEDYFFRAGESILWEELHSKLEKLLSDPEEQKERLKRGLPDQKDRAKRNRQLLESFVSGVTGMDQLCPEASY